MLLSSSQDEYSKIEFFENYEPVNSADNEYFEMMRDKYQRSDPKKREISLPKASPSRKGPLVLYTNKENISYDHITSTENFTNKWIEADNLTWQPSLILNKKKDTKLFKKESDVKIGKSTEYYVKNMKTRNGHSATKAAYMDHLPNFDYKSELKAILNNFNQNSADVNKQRCVSRLTATSLSIMEGDGIMSDDDNEFSESTLDIRPQSKLLRHPVLSAKNLIDRLHTSAKSKLTNEIDAQPSLKLDKNANEPIVPSINYVNTFNLEDCTDKFTEKASTSNVPKLDDVVTISPRAHEKKILDKRQTLTPTLHDISTHRVKKGRVLSAQQTQRSPSPSQAQLREFLHISNLRNNADAAASAKKYTDEYSMSSGSHLKLKTDENGSKTENLISVSVARDRKCDAEFDVTKLMHCESTSKLNENNFVRLSSGNLKVPNEILYGTDHFPLSAKESRKSDKEPNSIKIYRIYDRQTLKINQMPLSREKYEIVQAMNEQTAKRMEERRKLSANTISENMSAPKKVVVRKDEPITPRITPNNYIRCDIIKAESKDIPCLTPSTPNHDTQPLLEICSARKKEVQSDRVKSAPTASVPSTKSPQLKRAIRSADKKKREFQSRNLENRVFVIGDVAITEQAREFNYPCMSVESLLKHKNSLSELELIAANNDFIIVAFSIYEIVERISRANALIKTKIVRMKADDSLKSVYVKLKENIFLFSKITSYCRPTNAVKKDIVEIMPVEDADFECSESNKLDIKINLLNLEAEKGEFSEDVNLKDIVEEKEKVMETHKVENSPKKHVKFGAKDQQVKTNVAPLKKIMKSNVRSKEAGESAASSENEEHLARQNIVQKETLELSKDNEKDNKDAIRELNVVESIEIKDLEVLNDVEVHKNEQNNFEEKNVRINEDKVKLAEIENEMEDLRNVPHEVSIIVEDNTMQAEMSKEDENTMIVREKSSFLETSFESTDSLPDRITPELEDLSKLEDTSNFMAMEKADTMTLLNAPEVKNEKISNLANEKSSSSIFDIDKRVESKTKIIIKLNEQLVSFIHDENEVKQNEHEAFNTIDKIYENIESIENKISDEQKSKTDDGNFLKIPKSDDEILTSVPKNTNTAGTENERHNTTPENSARNENNNEISIKGDGKVRASARKSEKKFKTKVEDKVIPIVRENISKKTDNSDNEQGEIKKEKSAHKTVTILRRKTMKKFNNMKEIEAIPTQVSKENKSRSPSRTRKRDKSKSARVTKQYDGLELPYMPLPYCFYDPIADFDAYSKAFELPEVLYPRIYRLDPDTITLEELVFERRVLEDRIFEIRSAKLNKDHTQTTGKSGKSNGMTKKEELRIKMENEMKERTMAEERKRLQLQSQMRHEERENKVKSLTDDLNAKKDEIVALSSQLENREKEFHVKNEEIKERLSEAVYNEEYAKDSFANARAGMKREIEKKYDLQRIQLKERQAERRDDQLFKFEVQLKEVQFLYQIYTDPEDIERVREKERLIEQEQNSWLIKDSQQCEHEENEIDESEEFEENRLITLELGEEEIAIKPLERKRKEIQYEKQLLEEEFEKFKEDIRNNIRALETDIQTVEKEIAAIDEETVKEVEEKKLKVAELIKIEKEARQQITKELEQYRASLLNQRDRNLKMKTNLSFIKHTAAISNPFVFSYISDWPENVKKPNDKKSKNVVVKSAAAK